MAGAQEIAPMTMLLPQIEDSEGVIDIEPSIPKEKGRAQGGGITYRHAGKGRS
ncbi:MAG: hypothetical protein ACHQ6U_04895 [Thermodesulfobacteriota bacterium]